MTWTGRSPTVRRPRMSPQRRRHALAALLFVTGSLHFASPGFFDRIIPRWVPGAPRSWTLGSGVAELLCALLLLDRRTAKVGGWAAAATIAAVYPANVQAAFDAPPGTLLRVVLILRLPLQAPLFLWALRSRTP
jgi:uncharacterized membrane protein